jgi:hypothetical protein
MRCRMASELTMAILLVLITSSIGTGLAEPPGSAITRNPYEQTSQEGRRSEPTRTAAPAPQRSQHSTYTADYEHACAHPKDSEEADLCQQWRMAKASEDLADLAYWQILATGVEIFFLSLAVAFAGWAAFEARRAAAGSKEAAVATQKAAGAAIEANDLQREMFIAENRPWLCLESVSVAAPLTWDGGNARMKFQLCLQNFGRAVATDVHIRTTIELDSEAALLRTPRRLEHEEQAMRYTDLATGFIVIPGKPYVMCIENGVSRTVVDAQLTATVRHISPFFIGYVRYGYQSAQIRFGFPFNFQIFQIGRDGEPLPIGPGHGNIAPENLRLVPIPPSHTVFGG